VREQDIAEQFTINKTWKGYMGTWYTLMSGVVLAAGETTTPKRGPAKSKNCRCGDS
jgi:hypothetical protein